MIRLKGARSIFLPLFSLCHPCNFISIRSKLRIIVFFTFLLITYIFPVTIKGEKIVNGYYPNWLRQDFSSEKIDFTILTHITHAFAWPNYDGSLGMYSEMIDPDLNSIVHKEGREILIAIGGWGNSYAFSDVLSDSIKRSLFITNILNFIEINAYDGVDIDWEFPSSSLDRINLTSFMKELRFRMDEINTDYRLTMAISSNDYYGQWFDYTILSKYCDWFGVMTYDFHGSWTNHAGHNSPISAPLNCDDGSIAFTLDYLLNMRNLSPSKLLLGIPFYGKEFNASGLYKTKTGNVKDLIFNIIPGYLNSGWNPFWDNISEVPYLINKDSNRIITYDDSMSVRIKSEKAMEENLSGVMIWAIGYDFINGKQPLLQSIGKSLQTISLNVDFERPEKIELYSNYPNPFNSHTTIHYKIPVHSKFSLEIIDINGKTLETLISGYSKTASNSISWYPINLSSGLYFIRLSINNESTTRKILYVK